MNELGLQKLVGHVHYLLYYYCTLSTAVNMKWARRKHL